MSPIPLPAALAVLTLGLPVAAQSVWVVDASGGPGFDFGSIQTAIDTASDGDLILVREGAYGGNHVVDGKQLVLQAEGHVLLYGLEVPNLASDQFASVRGFELHAGAYTFRDNAGPLWFEDVTGRYDPFGWGTCLRFENCTSVVLKGCDFRGYAGAPSATLHALGSTLALYDTSLTGAVGRLTQQGQAGLSLSASRVFAMGCSFEGGRGGETVPPPFPPGVPGPGGNGATLLDGSVLEVVDTTAIGGPRGGPQPHPLGAPYVVEPGSTLRRRPHPAGSMTGGSPLREGHTTQLVFAGEPGDLVQLYVSREPGEWKDSPRRIGPRALHKILQVIPVGTIPPGGELAVDFTAPPIPGDWHGFFFQPAFLHQRDGALGSLVYGAPTQVHLLDAGF